MFLHLAGIMLLSLFSLALLHFLIPWAEFDPYALILVWSLLYPVAQFAGFFFVFFRGCIPSS